MNTDTHDSFEGRLSEYLDGELVGDERTALERHLSGCGACRALLADLEGIRAAARALGELAPAHDLWPALARALPGRARSRAWPPILMAFAAGVLLALGALWALQRGTPPEERVARGESYLFLLHEPAGFGAEASAEEHAALVERYAGWARELGERCLGGDELEPAGLELHPGAGAPTALADGARVGGYFLVEAADQAAAIEVARSCPHLAQGGWIELRRIRTH